ncbi:Spy/CpxP family protein refolding chaperone [Bradyrhizobium liaoningense]|uniref:Spy/CpxP family protein refolding chaperone n=1 Tax=Bradyrhizobium liaoningense TaxID=43992 RepID=UPI001BA5FA4D|nr:hypothetical protein [Bradyrhizobium liaoningense]MBR0712491.1 hypothetical protein [Bradyrhizobium liaoningense]
MRLILLAIVLLIPGVCRAETPYAGMQTRQVKALSDQQIADLRAGRGMGLALAAELNGYPGPSHVLELADQLRLTPDQRSKMQDMFAAMKSETTQIGNKLIDEETALDEQFASKTISPDSLRSATAAIAKTQGELREAHLKYHLLTSAVLDATQLAQYAELRGYTGAAPMQYHHHQK